MEAREIENVANPSLNQGEVGVEDELGKTFYELLHDETLNFPRIDYYVSPKTRKGRHLLIFLIFFLGLKEQANT